MGSQAVVDLTAYGERLTAEPYAVFAELREQGPVHLVRLPDYGEIWLIVGYDEVNAALNDPALSKNGFRATRHLVPDAIGETMLTSDPPQHTRLRRLVSKEFSARRLAGMRPVIQQITDACLDAIADADEVDLIENYSLPLSITVIAELLGVPQLDRDAFHRWSQEIVTPPAGRTRAEMIRGDLLDYLDRLVQQKREAASDDLFGALVRASDEGEDALSPSELRAMALLLLSAGHETTLNLIATGVLMLMRHPRQLEELRRDWSLLDGAIEETLRRDAPLLFSTRRFTTGPYPVGTTVIPGGGTPMLLALASANRDPAQFEEPDAFDIHRNPVGHLAFGHGIHHCLGAPLARIEGAIAIRSLLERFPDLSLATGQWDWQRTLTIRGLATLPVSLRG
ncbi:cytochrome P450 family protein [Nonomuraea aridisoli]|uniref:Cytochrome P450 n=1 Tax=Nonomuraea aridisoli TaxID=2070368 RepID=A0A2W2FRM1_9ACTN|nr:cytochrome P450 [Nonomuraea aridisoli]PZG17654.1 cytochrome P450 [Nonomuraea aridisoli]